MPQQELVRIVERCQDDAGIVRISFGIASNFADAAAAVDFLATFTGTGNDASKGLVQCCA